MVDRVLVEHTEELFLDRPALLALHHHVTEGAKSLGARSVDEEGLSARPSIPTASSAFGRVP